VSHSEQSCCMCTSHCVSFILHPDCLVTRMYFQGALDAAHQATRLPGSATACVLQLNRDAKSITAANLVRRLTFVVTGCVLWPCIRTDRGHPQQKQA